jgi:hypothetical protein
MSDIALRLAKRVLGPRPRGDDARGERAKSIVPLAGVGKSYSPAMRGRSAPSWSRITRSALYM